MINKQIPMHIKEADSNSSIHTEEMNYQSEGRLCKGYIAYDKNRKLKLPVVIIVHEWWGLNEYARSRARQIASLGYFAFAADPQADISKTAAIGYCFGGYVVVNAAKLGAPLKGVVSFHGRLVGVEAKKNLLKAKILICQGADDALVPETDQKAFTQRMDTIGADYTFISYPGAMHAYTNPDATGLGQKFNMPIAYNAAADSASWRDMQSFFKTIFK
jgi:dienelactone hydrolase